MVLRYVHARKLIENPEGPLKYPNYLQFQRQYQLKKVLGIQ